MVDESRVDTFIPLDLLKTIQGGFPAFVLLLGIA